MRNFPSFPYSEVGSVDQDEEKAFHNARQAFNLLDKLSARIRNNILLYHQALKAYSNVGMENTEQVDMFLGWMETSARDSVMAIFHFRMAMAEINPLVKKSTYLDAKFNPQCLRDSKKLFMSYFPNWKRLRDEIGHEAETILKDRSDFKIAFYGFFQNNTYVFGVDEEQYNLEMEPALFEKLSKVAEMVYTCFDPKG